MSHTSHLRTTLIAAVLAAALFAVLFAAGGQPRAQAAGEPASAKAQAALDKSHDLTGAAVLDSEFSTAVGHGDVARRKAQELSPQVPLPPGRTFAGINWDNGDLSVADIRGLLEYNAACKWWIAASRNPSDANGKIVQQIPSWPTFRSGDRHAVAEALAAGSGGNSELAAGILKDCLEAVGT